MTAAQRWRAVDHLKDRRVSERRACRLTDFSRSAAWYPLKGRDDVELRARLKVLADSIMPVGIGIARSVSGAPHGAGANSSRRRYCR